MTERGRSQGIGSRKGNRVTVTRWKGHPHYRWRAHFIQDGKKKAKGFKTKAAAEEWAEEKQDELLLSGSQHSLTATERSAVLDSRKALDDLGVDIRTALEFAIGHFEQTRNSCTVAELIERVIAERERSGRSDRYIQDMRSRLGRFGQQFGNRIVASITREEIAEWLH